MWANAQCDGRPVEYRWCPLLHAAVQLTPNTRVPCSNAANIGQHKTWMQSEFCTWQNSSTGARAAENVYIVYSWEPGGLSMHPLRIHGDHNFFVL